MVKLSYLISTYDSGSYLDSHIDDIIRFQNDPNFEIVIVNPNSPGTDDFIAKKWSDLDNRIKYIYHDKREWYGESWLRAWKAASGDFVINSNTDDFHEHITTSCVHEEMTNAINSNRKIGFAYGGITVINKDRHILGKGLKPKFDFDVMSRECWAGPQVVWRNDDEFKNSLDWDLMSKRASQYKSAFDYWLWLYFMSLGYHGHVIQKFLTVYMQREDSIENSNKWLNNWETYAAISEFFPHNFNNYLKHAAEFKDFNNLPSKDDWVTCMKMGNKWKTT